MSTASDNTSPKNTSSHSSSCPSKSSRALQGQQSVFRVTLHKPGTGPSGRAVKNVYYARRAHRKSRGGCAKCKERRIKCDETKPHCLRCRKHGVDCFYEPQPVHKHDKDIVTYLVEKVPSLVSPDSSAHSLSLSAISKKINELLQLNPKDGKLSDNLRSLHHFHEHTMPTVDDGSTEAFLWSRTIQLALQSPFLMHGIIGIATTHLCHILPDKSAYTAVEAYHWQKAINQYSQEISHVGSHNMDPLFSACFLMTVHSFRLETYNPHNSFVFSDNPNALNWLLLQSGLRHLLGLSRRWLATSIYFDMFMTSRNENPLFDDHRTGREGLDPAFADLCDINETDTEETNPYHWPVRMLTPLLSAERSTRSFSKYMNFVGRLTGPFYDRVLAKDPPALLILAWWLGMVDSAHFWWMETRIKSECAAICMYLEYSDDPRVLVLLEFPAQVSGYLLRHVQERMMMVKLNGRS
ncbi:Zn(II)2Cys6 transcription factor [Aspergillus affinis]|uniref:Zn(II)2Cys6 transcription factor n=1 Tax=Aspergillus affinis TaxID=1070780 RepID=UPI0022FE1241|nr:C6 transcription factor [Aspergillus affinis]KAI9039039.1 C6 transcription factor [Aspergillus affinis]